MTISPYERAIKTLCMLLTPSKSTLPREQELQGQRASYRLAVVCPIWHWILAVMCLGIDTSYLGLLLRGVISQTLMGHCTVMTLVSPTHYVG